MGGKGGGMGGMGGGRPGMMPGMMQGGMMGGMRPMMGGKGGPMGGAMGGKGMQQPMQQQRPMMQQQMPMQQRPPMSAGDGGLTAATLANAPPGMQKQMLGEKIFPLIARLQPEMAGKITGMMLEMDNSELLILLESPEQLKMKVDE